MNKITYFILLISLLFASCESEPEQQKDTKKYIFYQNGIATWYGPGFHGKKTASGEKYSMYALTAAHLKLKLGTIVRVTNLKNGKQVIVKINDRGPYSKSLIIDLSKAAAEKLDMLYKGSTKVKLEILRDSTKTQQVWYEKP